MIQQRIKLVSEEATLVCANCNRLIEKAKVYRMDMVLPGSTKSGIVNYVSPTVEKSFLCNACCDARDEEIRKAVSNGS